MALAVTVGCQSPGFQANQAVNELNKVSLMPAPALRPISAVHETQAGNVNKNLMVSGQALAAGKQPNDRSLRIPQQSPNSTSLKPIASGQFKPGAPASEYVDYQRKSKFNSPLTARLRNAGRSSDAVSSALEVASSDPPKPASKSQTSMLVAYQEGDGGAEKIGNAAAEDMLPFDDEGSINDGDSIDDTSSTPSLLDLVPTNNAATLTLDDVITSVTNCYPEIEIAIGEIEQSRGMVLASWGEFDSVFSAHSIAQPLGFYQTYRNGAGISRPLYGGGEVYGTYRIGDGNFEPWYGERETNEGGELKAGFSLPLLKDRAIDKRRADVRTAELNRDQVEANVETRLLKFERFATQAYWDWVASGQAVTIQRQLLKLAQQRVEQISVRIEQGDLAKIAEIDNDRFIAKRKNGLIKANRGLEKAAIKLSLFLRDENCFPVIARAENLPEDFPFSQRIAADTIINDIGQTLQRRPELIELDAARAEACVKLQYANNLLLPKLDVKGFAGQDLGGATSSKGDKTPFELQLGVFAEVPLQRREGAGKIQAAQGKITQIDAKRRFVTDKIRAEVQDAASAVNAAFDQIRQSRENVRLNEQSLELGRLAFEEGDIELLALNIYESSVADARLQLLEAEHKYFYSLAIYRTITQSESFIGR